MGTESDNAASTRTDMATNANEGEAPEDATDQRTAGKAEQIRQKQGCLCRLCAVIWGGNLLHTSQGSELQSLEMEVVGCGYRPFVRVSVLPLSLPPLLAVSDWTALTRVGR